MPMTINGDGSITGLVAGGLPDATIVQADLAAGVAGNGPAFSASANAAQTLTNSTFTKLTFSVEDFDTNSNFASSTFTPTVAGYYQINYTVNGNAATSLTRLIGALYKNGSVISRDIDVTVSAGQNPVCVSGAKIVYMNGTTDYLEIYGFITGTGTLTSGANSTTTNYFSACLVRSA